MKSKLIDENTFAVIFETGDEVASGLTAFAKEHVLSASHFTAIGAFQDVTLGYFDWDKKTYKRIQIAEQVEVLMLAGDIALDQGKPKVHAHVVVGKSDGTAHGGHLLEAHVRPTLELIVTEAPAGLRKRFDPESRLALIDVEDGAAP